MTTSTYRDNFKSPAKAAEYEFVNYSAHTYDSLLWSIEKKILTKFILHFKLNHEQINYLDFATGTGRVATYLKDYVHRASGVDVSEAMIDIARAKAPDIKFCANDITDPKFSVAEKYDLVTAFRFVLNAEPDLRRRALSALVKLMKDDSSRLVINNHGNPISHKLILWPFHQAHRLASHQSLAGNYLSHPTMIKLFNEVGLEIVDQVGYGFLSGKLSRFFSVERALRIEHGLMYGVLSKFGVSQIYILKRST